MSTLLGMGKKNVESILLYLVAGDMLEWYVTVTGYTARIGGGTTNEGTTMFNAIRLSPGYILQHKGTCSILIVSTPGCLVFLLLYMGA
jgi:hypothetical protein